MNPIIGALLGIVVALGVVVIIYAFQPPAVDGSTSSKPSLQTRWKRLRASMDGTTFTLLWVGVVAGVGLSLISGWVPLVLAVPAAFVFVPRMLSGKQSREAIAKLDAIEGWTRSLAGLVATHATLERSVTHSAHSAPDRIAKDVAVLSARLQAKWDTRSALLAFADEVDDPSADVVVAHLLLATDLSGPGLAAALEQAAGSIQDEVRTRRDIEATRESQRQVMRIIVGFAVIAVLGIALASPLAGNYFAPYRTVEGQLLLVVILACMAGALFISHQMSKQRRIPRVLGEVGVAKTEDRWSSIRQQLGLSSTPTADDGNRR